MTDFIYGVTNNLAFAQANVQRRMERYDEKSPHHNQLGTNDFRNTNRQPPKKKRKKK